MSSVACRAIPAVVTAGYKAKGTYGTIAGLRTYITGDESTAKRGVVDVYDIFGLIDQTIQGADRLAAMLDAVVLLPDFFKGKPLTHDLFPVDTDEKKARVQGFMQEGGAGAFPQNVEALREVTKEAKAKYSSVKGWGALGFCWGGKIVALTSGEGTPFAASGQAHPGRLAKEDAEKITIPHLCLASDGEPADIVQAYKEILGDRGEVETYTGMPHGWMSARADFAKEDIVRGYEKGYKQSADFFARYL